MRIICGTDFSDQSGAAVTAAAVLVARTRATELWLVHVLDSTTGSLGSDVLEVVKTVALERLESESVRIAERVRDAGAQLHHAVLVGPASETLLRFAEEKQALLLVVSSLGHGSSFVLRVGGTSERIAQSARMPVLIVRDAAPYEAWDREDRPLRLLLAVDWSRSCDGAIRWVKDLRKSSPVDVVVGYIYESGFPGDGPARYGLARSPSILERHLGVEELLIRDLQARTGELGGPGDVVYRPYHGIGRIGDHVLELAEQERADLIVVGTHHRRGLARLGSVAAVTLHHSRASVAIIPVAEDELSAPGEVPRIRRILIATDLSPLSRFAIPHGYSLLGGRGGEVFLLHVRDTGSGGTGEADLVAELRSLVPTRNVPPGAVTRIEVVEHRDPSQAICQAAERLGVDAICVASHGRGGISRAILGSVAEAVMRASRRPVFVVRPLPP